MNVYLQGLSALAYYRNGGTATDVERCSSAVRSMAEATSSRSAIVDTGIWRLGIGELSVEHPFEVLVRDKGQRARSKAVQARIWSTPVAATAFRTVRRNIYVSSPEFVFLQLATRLDLPELVALGMELCGTYRRKVRVPHIDSDEIGFTTNYHQAMLTTPKRLRGFLDSMRPAPGCGKALKALEYVLPNSASPMETAIYLLLCLPRRLGGYALPQPILNPAIAISKSGQQYTLRKSAKPDLFWKKIRLDLEYNSDEFHEENQRASDSMRRKALEHMGVEVIELTSDELLSVELFHATALRIARRFKKRIRSEHEGGFSERRLELRNMLFLDGETKGDTSYEPVEDDVPPTDTEDIWTNEAFGSSLDSLEGWDDEGTWDAELIDPEGDERYQEDDGYHVFGAGK